MKKVIWFSLLHGLNDCIAGFLLGGLLNFGIEHSKIVFYVLFYNVLSFLGQPLVALLLNTIKSPKSVLVITLLSLILGVFLFQNHTFIGVILIGVSSSIVHVVGGVESYGSRQRASDIGIFAAPGVFGLAVGGVMAYAKTDASLVLVSLSILLGVAYFVLNRNEEKKLDLKIAKLVDFEDHDLIMLLLLGVISLRSIVWNVFQTIHTHDYWTLLYFGMAAMLGKLFGGALSDRFGAKKFAYFSILSSIPFLTFWKGNLCSSLFGVFLLQSSFPATTLLLLHRLQNKIDLGIAYSFGISVVLGGLLYFSPLQFYLMKSSGLFVLLLLTFAMLLYYDYKSQKTL